VFYTSRATRTLTTDDLHRILVESRVRNERENVTGVLTFIGGRFAQYLEGPKDGLERLVGLVKASPLHAELVMGEPRTIYERHYDNWSMAFLADDDMAGGLAPLPPRQG